MATTPNDIDANRAYDDLDQRDRGKASRIHMTYPSKKDWWVTFILVPECFVIAGVGVFLLAQAMMQAVALEALAGGLVMVFVGIMLLWVFSSTGYEISPPHLIIRCGPFRRSVPLDRIAEIKAKQGLSMEMGWNFALSQDRLFITLRKPNGRAALFGVAVSPKDKEGFLRELAQEMSGLTNDRQTVDQEKHQS